MNHPNTYIDGLLWGNTLDSNTITYSFWNTIEPGFDDWSNAEKVAMQQALETWSNVANINFTQVEDNTVSADFKFNLIDFKLLDIFPDGALAYFGAPGEPDAGIGLFNSQGAGWDLTGRQQGGLGFVTMIHELGHGLGLAHPHDNGGGSSLFPGVVSDQDLGEYELNQGVWTTMSYNPGWESENGEILGQGITDYGYQGTPMAFDIAAIQYLYGANMSYKTGDDAYQLPDSNTSGTFYSALWDAGGDDTISAASATADATIDLNDAPLVGENAGGYMSYVEGVYGGFTIANGVVIENAIGGAGDDTIIGNEADNSIKGGKGNDLILGWSGDDSLYGEAGNDYILGWNGDDSLYGGAGNDSLRGNFGSDYLNGGGGNDELYGENDDDILEGRKGSDHLYGGAGHDKLFGHSEDDYLDGGDGDDSLYGGADNDTLLGNTGDDKLFGHFGEDSLDGGADDDRLYGGADNDTLLGNTGSDTLVGGLGNDILNGYGGFLGEQDILIGNEKNSQPDVTDSADGADTFVLGNSSVGFYVGAGYAIIKDFNGAEGDKLQLHGDLNDYSFGSQNWSNNNIQDTLIYYQNDLISVVEDNTNIVASSDFIFV